MAAIVGAPRRRGAVIVHAAAVPLVGHGLPGATPCTSITAVDKPAPALDDWLARLGTDPQAAQQVYTLLYGELHRAAAGHMRREAAGHTLSATALVNETWLRLSAQTRTAWQNRQHFVAVASTMMRRILVDHAVAHRAAKREAELQVLNTTLVDRHALGVQADVVAVHEALLALEQQDPRAAQVVELKFFGGLDVDEIAQALDISRATVKRDWALARAWLRRELGGQTEP
ncbi:ECF-type sigma factor [Rubrivivax rivuli]|uniref:ECF-type sigma factor n=1 Tax=Rubrivivax rivuli TaxID=1862385 RepID=UPI0013E339CA|nr:ECF-type sigma factor [Rubrivivax rivuli]